MRVLFVNSVLDFGSTGKIVRDLSNSLIEDGHEVLIAYGKYSPKDRKNTIDLSGRVQGYIHFLLSKYLGRHGLHSARKTKKLIREIRTFNPDVVHLHNLHGCYINVPMLLKYLKKTESRIILTLHDTWTISGSSASFDFNGCKVWNDGCEVCNSTLDYPVVSGYINQKKNLNWKKKHFSGFRNMTLVSPSFWLQDLVQKSYLRQYNCVVVKNGIDTTIFRPTQNDELENRYKGRKVLLGVTNVWEKRKGLDDFVKLSKIISKDYQIILIGLSKEQIISLPKEIIGIERTSNSTELACYYSLAYAFLNPTYEDNFPTTNIEALSCGTRVIAYDTGGISEVKGVEVVERGNITELYSKIQEVKPKSELEDFSKELFSNQMMSLYKNRNKV